jgi:hypothetical protein
MRGVIIWVVVLIVGLDSSHDDMTAMVVVCPRFLSRSRQAIGQPVSVRSWARVFS